MSNICVNCKHCSKNTRPLSFNSLLLECDRNIEFKQDLVYGISINTNNGKSLKCYAEREDALRLEDVRCGVSGKYFESIED